MIVIFNKLIMDFVKEIIKNNGEVYIVGGAIRNIFFNKIHNKTIPIKDRDLLVRLIEEEDLCKLLKKFGSVKSVGQMFGVIKFKQFKCYQEIDIALPRKEISTGLGYRDFIITSDHNISLQEDFMRRDATINAMAVKINSLEDLNK